MTNYLTKTFIDSKMDDLLGPSNLERELGPIHGQNVHRRKVYGYEIRDPFDSERSYFRQNPNVAGMAAEDGRVTLNPYSRLTAQQQDAVARNEAARLYIRDRKLDFDFDPTHEQQRSFAGTAYANDPYNMRATILARIISNDPSAGQVTPRQQEWADWIKTQLQRGQGDVVGTLNRRPQKGNMPLMPGEMQ